ncbi:hypothetical protein D3C81_819210 [compost metagenome]
MLKISSILEDLLPPDQLGPKRNFGAMNHSFIQIRQGTYDMRESLKCIRHPPTLVVDEQKVNIMGMIFHGYTSNQGLEQFTFTRPRSSGYKSMRSMTLTFNLVMKLQMHHFAAGFHS